MSSINVSFTRSKITNWVTSTLREAAWAPLSVVGFYLLGLAFHLFDKIPQMDIPTHFFGGVAITYFYRTAIRNAQEFLGDIPLPVQILLAFTATGTTAVFWEFYENIMDHFFGFHMVLGLGDTIKDLFDGILGALMLSVFYKQKQPFDIPNKRNDV